MDKVIFVTGIMPAIMILFMEYVKSSYSIRRLWGVSVEGRVVVDVV